jgi:glutathione peroxidase
MKLLLSLLLFTGIVSIHSYNITTSQGNISLQDYEGKKILLVNIATRGQYTSQIQQLEQLYQQYHDSLLIIAFPSNSFGNEPHGNTDLAEVLTDSFHVTYPFTERCTVTGVDKHAIYDWLADSSKNGRGSVKLSKDFQKILIGKDGRIEGIFNSMVSPMDNKVQQAITRIINN